MSNKRVALIVGEAATGKSTSFYWLQNQEKVIFMNCDSGGKMLPFKAKFKYGNINHPQKVFLGFEQAKKGGAYAATDVIIIDTVTYLMEQFITQFIHKAEDGRAAWGDYQQYFKTLMQKYVAEASQSVLLTAHTLPIRNDSTKIVESKVPIQGQLSKLGLESFFTLIVATKKMELEDLEPYSNNLLTITPEDEMLGYKHVFQTRLTKDSVHERIRAPMGMWEIKESFIDANAQYLLDRMNEYYGTN